MFDLNGTFWIQIINFAIFFALLNVVFLRPVGAAIKKRRAYIESIAADYDRYAHQSESLRADAERRRVAARRDAQEAVARAKSAAERDAAGILAEATTKAEDVARAARARVAAEDAAARARATEVSTSLAHTLLARAIGSTS